MDKRTFVKQEGRALRRFMDKHANDDFSLSVGGVTYSRRYACPCGFKTRSAEAIHDHVAAEHGAKS